MLVQFERVLPVTIKSNVGFNVLPKGNLTHGWAEREPDLRSSDKRLATLLLHHGHPSH